MNRTPDYQNPSFDSMTDWFAAMSGRDLLFHPDDPAESIVDIATGEAIFTADEACKADAILNAMFSHFGEQVYEAAYPFFMERMVPAPKG